jgi:hypothetical protein
MAALRCIFAFAAYSYRRLGDIEAAPLACSHEASRTCAALPVSGSLGGLVRSGVIEARRGSVCVKDTRFPEGFIAWWHDG